MLLSFFTIWSLIMYAILLFLSKYNYFTPIMYQFSSIIITNSILGTYLIYKNIDKLEKKINQKKIVIIIADILTHILPLIYIYINFKPKNISRKWLIKGQLFKFLFGITYLKFKNPEKVYSFSKLSNKKLILGYLTVHISILFFYKKI